MNLFVCQILSGNIFQSPSKTEDVLWKTGSIRIYANTSRGIWVLLPSQRSELWKAPVTSENKTNCWRGKMETSQKVTILLRQNRTSFLQISHGNLFRNLFISVSNTPCLTGPAKSLAAGFGVFWSVCVMIFLCTLTQSSIYVICKW